MPVFLNIGGIFMYAFDKNLFGLVVQSLRSGTNLLKDQKLFEGLIDMSKVDQGVELNGVRDRYNDDFDYIMTLRSKGTSIANRAL
jgi:hypothetical protein